MSKAKGLVKIKRKAKWKDKKEKERVQRVQRKVEIMRKVVNWNNKS